MFIVLETDQATGYQDLIEEFLLTPVRTKFYVKGGKKVVICKQREDTRWGELKRAYRWRKVKKYEDDEEATCGVMATVVGGMGMGVGPKQMVEISQEVRRRAAEAGIHLTSSGWGAHNTAFPHIRTLYLTCKSKEDALRMINPDAPLCDSSLISGAFISTLQCTKKREKGMNKPPSLASSDEELESTTTSSVSSPSLPPSPPVLKFDQLPGLAINIAQLWPHTLCV